VETGIGIILGQPILSARMPGMHMPPGSGAGTNIPTGPPAAGAHGQQGHAMAGMPHRVEPPMAAAVGGHGRTATHGQG
jgi:hypothetical protein